MSKDYGYTYSYPPNSASEKRESPAAPNHQSRPSVSFARQASYGSNNDEKLEKSTSAFASATPGDNDDDLIPPAIPRIRPTSNWTPGHGHSATRGSIALQAAAEGKIPKKEGLKMWRSDEHHGTFTAGGKRRTCMRCCACTIVLALITIIGVIASFLLWVRPPNVAFKGVMSPQDGTQQLTISSSGFNLNLDLEIAVSNPNFFGASFKKIQAKAYYPTNTETALGGGIMNNVRIPAHSHNTLFFPFAINYTKAIDPNNAILEDIATKCGFIGSQTSNINVNYDLTLSLNIAGISISPTFKSQTSFGCPLSLQDVQGLVGGSDVSGLLGGGGGS